VSTTRMKSSLSSTISIFFQASSPVMCVPSLAVAGAPLACCGRARILMKRTVAVLTVCSGAPTVHHNYQHGLNKATSQRMQARRSRD